MAYAALTHVTAFGKDGVTSSSIDTTGADFLVMVVGAYKSFPPTVSDSKSNTWSALTLRDSGDSARILIYYVANPTVGTGHTFTLTGSSSYGSMCVHAFSGAKLTSPFDVENGVTGGVDTSRAPGSITPSENNELLITGGTQDAIVSNLAIGSSYTLADNVYTGSGTNFASSLAYLIQTTAGASNPTWSWTTSSHNAEVIASFKVAAATFPGGDDDGIWYIPYAA